MQSEQINELATALAKAQGEMKAATFNRINPHFKNRYADLAAIFDAVRGPLSKNGLAVTQTEGDGNLTTTLMHTSGQWIKSQRPLPVNGRPQEYGSALTYARRYSLSSIVGIAADDDDDAQVAQNAKPNGEAKRENPHVTRAEDIVEHDLEYDAEGNPIDNIPLGNPEIKRMSKAMARPEHANLTAEIRATKSLDDLKAWGELETTKNRVASLPSDWERQLRDVYKDHMIDLGWKPEQKATA